MAVDFDDDDGGEVGELGGLEVGRGGGEVGAWAGAGGEQRGAVAEAAGVDREGPGAVERVAELGGEDADAAAGEIGAGAEVGGECADALPGAAAIDIDQADAGGDGAEEIREGSEIEDDGAAGAERGLGGAGAEFGEGDDTLIPVGGACGDEVEGGDQEDHEGARAERGGFTRAVLALGCGQHYAPSFDCTQRVGYGGYIGQIACGRE